MDVVLRTIKSGINHYQSFRPFTDQEAWTLFKVAALAEAVGWSLLIFGIVWREYIIPGSHVFVAVGGRIHGMVFVAYIIAVLALAPSMRWPLPQTIIGGLMSIPPYGSLIYEAIVAQMRGGKSAQTLLTSTLYRQLTRA